MDVVYAAVEGVHLFMPIVAVFVLLAMLYHYKGRLGEGDRILVGEVIRDDGGTDDGDENGGQKGRKRGQNGGEGRWKKDG
uniref:Preprotein translocase subunit YajC n=1 Tax=Globodera pallida TaxID=36090 RepID=A0A183BIC8_GLOPA